MTNYGLKIRNYLTLSIISTATLIGTVWTCFYWTHKLGSDHWAEDPIEITAMLIGFSCVVGIFGGIVGAMENIDARNRQQDRAY